MGAPAARPLRAVRPAVLLNGIVPWLFLATGPYMLLLDAATEAGLPQGAIVSWFLAGLVAGGSLTILLNAWFRLPVCSSMTIHGSLLAVASLARLAFPEVVGAFLMAGVLVSLLAASGLAARLVDHLPLPIVSGMVTGVLFPFALKGVGAAANAPLLAAITVLAFLLAARFRPRLGGIPPTFFAVSSGVLAAALTGQADWGAFTWQLGTANFTAPTFTFRGFIELALPLTVMVIGVHGAQSAGILRGAGFPYKTRAYTLAVGLTSLGAAPFGAAPLCILGPPLAMLVSGIEDGEDDGRWAAGIVTGMLLIALGLMSPMLANIRHWLPGPLVSIIAGLAVLGVLEGYLARAFSGPFRTGAVFAFIVTASGVTFLGIGSALWGVVIGLLVSAVVEPQHFKGRAGSVP